MIYTLSVTTKTLHDVGHNVGHSELFSFPEMEQFQSYNNKQPCSERSQSKQQSKVIPVETFCVIFVLGGGGELRGEVIHKLLHNSPVCGLQLVFTISCCVILRLAFSFKS